MKNKKDLLLDVDDVICFPGFLPAINDFLKSNYKIDDFTNYYMEEEVIPKEQMEAFNHFLRTKNLYEQATVLPGAVETIRALQELYNIYICSACVNPFDLSGSGKLFKDKYDYLLHLLPFLNPEQFIFTNAKHLLKAEIQIDDRLSNLNDSVNTKILFPSYHNKTISEEELKKKEIIRAGYEWQDGWERVADLLLVSRPYTLKKKNF